MSSGLKNNPHFYEPMSSAAREYVNVCQRENRSRIAQKVRLPFHISISLQFSTCLVMNCRINLTPESIVEKTQHQCRKMKSEIELGGIGIPE